MKKTLTLLCLAMLLSLGACHQSTPVAEVSSFQFTDDYGRTVDIPSNPQRIVSLSPGVTEILYALGAQDHLVGRTDFCSYPAECQSIESIGGISNLNIEKVVSLKPDLVIGGSLIPQAAVEQLQQLGIAVALVTEQQQFEGLFTSIAKIGLLCGRSDRADSLNEALHKLLPSVDSAEVHPTVYYVAGFGASGNYTAGGNTFINDIIALAGGSNIAADMEGWSYSLEALMAKDPDYVVIRREDSARFVTAKPYCQLKAVKEGKVVAIESGTIDVQVPRNVEAIQYLASRFAR